MEKLFRHNGWLKIVSAALAVLMWAMVMPTYTADATRTFDVVLEVKPHPTFQTYEGPDEQHPMYVQVRAEGKNLVISRLNKEDFTATVDYSKVTEPNKPVAVEVQLKGPRAQATYTVYPKTITATLVQTREESFPVTLEPAVGVINVGGKEYKYTANTTTRVTVRGRTDYLDQVARVRVAMDSAELSPNATLHLIRSAVPVDAAGKPIEKLTGKDVPVDLAWEELPPGRSYKIQPVTKGAIAGGYVVGSIDVDPPSIMLRADTLQGQLPAGDVIETAPIDLVGRTKSFTAAVAILHPVGTSVAVETVKVHVNINETTMEKTLKAVPLKLRGQSPGTDATLATPTVNITVSGPFSVVTTLDASTVSAFVDVAGLSAGKHLLAVKYTQPTGVTSVVLDPAVVEVTITAKP